MADTIASSFDIKIGYKFSDEDDPTQWITFPDPKNLTAVKGGLSNIENLAVDNNLLIGSKFKSAVEKIGEVKTVAKTDTTVDWR